MNPLKRVTIGWATGGNGVFYVSSVRVSPKNVFLLGENISLRVPAEMISSLRVGPKAIHDCRVCDPQKACKHMQALYDVNSKESLI